MSEIGTVGVVGAGTMGHGIAQVAAQAGFAVRLVDLSPEALAKGLAAIGGSLEKLAAKRIELCSLGLRFSKRESRILGKPLRKPRVVERFQPYRVAPPLIRRFTLKPGMMPIIVSGMDSMITPGSA